MKKLLMIMLVSAFGFNANAQSAQFGATAGALGTAASVKFDGDSADIDQEVGFFVGVTAEFELSEQFKLQPELSYANVNDGSTILLPIIGKYYVADAFNLQFGPTIAFSLEDIPDDNTGLGIDITAGIGYDFGDNFSARARYNYQLNNSYTGDLDIDAKGHFWTVGLGYKFN